MISNVNGHGVSSVAGHHNQQVVKAPQLSVQPVKNAKMTAPTAWQPNPSGKLSVKPASGGKMVNPQMGQPPLRASWTGPVQFK